MQTLEPRKTLVEQTYEALVDAICLGTLPAGERLTEDALAARLNVSRQPVNAALAMLRANKLVEATGRRGVVVAPIDPALFRSIYDFRSVVEPLAVELAGRYPLSDEMKREGERIVRDGWVAKRADDTLGMVRADVEFHGLIYKLSRNSVIENTMRIYWQHIRRAMVAILSGKGYPETVWSQHEAIFTTLVDGRTEDAAAIMRQHITGGAAVMEVQAFGSPADSR